MVVTWLRLWATGGGWMVGVLEGPAELQHFQWSGLLWEGGLLTPSAAVPVGMGLLQVCVAAVGRGWKLASCAPLVGQDVPW
jgi:hypothetical protein